MLNELLIIERGAKQAGVEMVIQHPDIALGANIPTLIISLENDGKASSLRVKPSEISPWTIRNAGHNSFPFIQPKPPFLVTAEISTEDKLVASVLDPTVKSLGRVITADCCCCCS